MLYTIEKKKYKFDDFVPASPTVALSTVDITTVKPNLTPFENIATYMCDKEMCNVRKIVTVLGMALLKSKLKNHISSTML